VRLCDQVGLPFEEGGRDPQRGIDCLGLVLVLTEQGRGFRPADPYQAALDWHRQGQPGERPEHLAPAGWVPVQLDQVQPWDVVEVTDQNGVHVALVAEDGWVLTTTRRSGASKLVPWRAMRRVARSAWRLHPQAVASAAAVQRSDPGVGDYPESEHRPAAGHTGAQEGTA